MQKYSSAETSINSSKLPAIYGKLAKQNIRDCHLLDYGCGKYLRYIKIWCKARNIKYLPYDIFNQPQKVNEASLLAASKAENLVVICSNVLNVIEEDDIVQNIVETLVSFKAPVFTTIYEGDGKGKGRATKRDCWQRNEKLRQYARFFPEHARVERGMIVCG